MPLRHLNLTPSYYLGESTHQTIEWYESIRVLNAMFRELDRASPVKAIIAQISMIVKPVDYSSLTKKGY